MTMVAIRPFVAALRTDSRRAETLRAALGADAAFGVFGGFQIMNFDGFLFFHYLALLSWIVTCLCYVSSTEQQPTLTPANDILLGDQVVQTDQFLFLALLPSTC